MAWIYLLIAGFCEITWAIGLKYCDGVKNIPPLAIAIAAMVASIIFLYLAMKTIPIGTAYAIWTGIGIVGVATYGIFFFGEPVSAMRIACICIILVGIAGLKLTSV